MKEEAQSQSEGSFGNGVSLNADEGATDSGFSLILSDRIAGILFVCLIPLHAMSQCSFFHFCCLLKSVFLLH